MKERTANILKPTLKSGGGERLISTSCSLARYTVVEDNLLAELIDFGSVVTPELLLL